MCAFAPDFNVHKNEFDGMEALIRWPDAEQGFIAPDQFIPFAEEYGLIAKIDEWVLRTAMQQTKHWNEKYGRALKIAVNISPQHLAEKSFIKRLKSIIKAVEFPPHLLEIEITESTMMNLNNVLLEKLQAIRTMGISIAIDDFGTGFSCLSYLRTLPITTLKIDRSFTRQLKNNTGQTMVTSIISLGHALNLDLVAEGVEHSHELDFLKKQACESIQGYYFSKPLPRAVFEAQLQTK
ncbi:MAG: EAL domain-containing protein [Solibacillus sp.]